MEDTDEKFNGLLEDQSLDSLFQATVDTEALKDAETRMALPAGTYTVQPPMQTTRFKAEDGRETVKMWGKVEGVDENGQTIKGSVSYSIGWEPRNGFIYENGENTGRDNGKPDSATKNYIMGKKIFKAAYGSDPGSPGDVIVFLRDYAHRLRLGNFEGRNHVFALSPTK